MDWLNFHVGILDSAEFVGSEPTDRGTWLCLQRYCAGQENGGVISGCADWADRKWQQVARVTLREVRRTCELWRWDGDDLHVQFYPIDKQREVQAKRQAGVDTARKRWSNRTNEQGSLALRSNGSSATSLSHPQPHAEGKGMEGEEGARASAAESRPAPPGEESEEEWLARLRREWPRLDIDSQLRQAEAKRKRDGRDLERVWFERHWLPHCSPTHKTRRASDPSVQPEPFGWREMLRREIPDHTLVKSGEVDTVRWVSLIAITRDAIIDLMRKAS